MSCCIVKAWKTYFSNIERISSLENREKRHISALYRKYRAVFVSTLIFGLLSYMWFLTNKIVNFDEVACLFGKGSALVVGRWGLPLTSYIFPDVSLPWLWGIATILIFSVTMCMIVNILHIESSILQIILAGACVTFSSQTDIMLFMFTAPSYAVSFFLSVLAVKLFQISGEHKIVLLFSLISEVLSLSIYQAFVAVSAGLLVMILIKKIITEPVLKTEQIRIVLARGIFSVLFLAVSMGVYYSITMYLQRNSGVEFDHWANRAIENPSGLFERIWSAYEAPFLIFMQGKHGLVRTELVKVLNAVLFLTGYASGFYICLKCDTDRTSRTLLFALLSVVALPLAIGGLYLVLTNSTIHSIVMFGNISYYIFIVMIVDLLKDNLTGRNILPGAANIVTLCLLVVALDNIYFANKIGLKQFMEFENTFALYNSVYTQLQMTDDYDKECKVVIAGDAPRSNYWWLFGLPEHGKLFGISEFRNNYSRTHFISYYLGYNVKFASDEETRELMLTDEFLDLPCYPDDGYIKRMDDYMVIKFSDTKDDS